MKFQIKMKRSSFFWYYLYRFLCILPLTVLVHYCKTAIMNQINFRYNPQTNLNEINMPKVQCKHLQYEIVHLRKEIMEMREEMDEIRSWKTDTDQNFEQRLDKAFDSFYSDQIGMFDYAAEYAGGAIISTPETAPFPSKFGLLFFGAIDWVTESEPNVIIQHNTFPGKCYAFYGDKARIRIKLGRPVAITHVTLEHIRIGENINTAPKRFEVLGFGENIQESLGNFIYDLDDSVIQTFPVILKNQTFRSVELRILSNYGNDEFTCVYRFRVHSLNFGFK